ncbi:hypothetical protein [Hymenobacter sp. AT01-02]|uniref:hypothetical protein n=1 Tax=Hymenobacter sp. AT01-02 TaxID=1571877 RepID=UPI0005F146DB|nr:hypothetical protein [Hymenobacter sp. AT01-02]
MLPGSPSLSLADLDTSQAAWTLFVVLVQQLTMPDQPLCHVEVDVIFTPDEHLSRAKIKLTTVLLSRFTVQMFDETYKVDSSVPLFEKVTWAGDSGIVMAFLNPRAYQKWQLLRKVVAELVQEGTLTEHTLQHSLERMEPGVVLSIS